MYNFTLTNSATEYKINAFFLSEIVGHSHISPFLREKVDFNQIFTDFSNNPWGGGLNNFSSDLIMYQQLEEFFNKNKIRLALRLDCSNVFLSKEDFFNTYNNLILEKGSNGSTVIEISNLQLYSFIKEKFPIYTKFILSPNAWQIIDLTPEMVNAICENNDFHLISLPPHLAHNEEYLQALTYKNKIEITVNPICPIYCPNYGECIKFENEANHNFSEKTVIKTCQKRFNYYKNPQVSDFPYLKEKYSPLGITHFKIAEFPHLSENDIDYFLFLVQYFVKDEYHEQVIKKFLKFDFSKIL